MPEDDWLEKSREEQRRLREEQRRRSEQERLETDRKQAELDARLRYSRENWRVPPGQRRYQSWQEQRDAESRRDRARGIETSNNVYDSRIDQGQDPTDLGFRDHEVNQQSATKAPVTVSGMSRQASYFPDRTTLDDSVNFKNQPIRIGPVNIQSTIPDPPKDICRAPADRKSVV